MNTLQKALVLAGFKPSANLILENKINKLHWFLRHSKYSEAEILRGNIIGFCKNNNLKLPEELREKEIK